MNNYVQAAHLAARQELVNAYRAKVAEAKALEESIKTFDTQVANIKPIEAAQAQAPTTAPTPAKKIDGRSKEARAAKAAAAAKSAKKNAKAITAKKAVTAAKKTATKAVASAKKTPAKATATSKKAANAVAEGRRAVARGDRPVLKQAIAMVMGKAVCDSQTIVDGLSAKGWLPGASNPKAYISYALSNNKDVFERVEGKRGFYRVKPGVNFTHTATKTAKKTPAVTTAAKPANGTKPANGVQVDKELESLGIGEGSIAENPF